MTGEWRDVEDDSVDATSIAGGSDYGNPRTSRDLELEPLHPDGGGDTSESDSGNERQRQREKRVYTPYQEDTSKKGPAWIVLATLTTLIGRWLLRGPFPYPIYFVFLLQSAAYCAVVGVVILLQIGCFPRRSGKKDDIKYTITQTLGFAARWFIAACLCALAMLYGAKAVMLYNNLYVLAMLPILRYVFDAIILRFLHLARISPRDNITILWIPLWKIFPIVTCILLAVHLDYRLDIRGFNFALASFLFSSLASAVHKVGPRIQKRVEWTMPYYFFLCTSIPIIYLTHLAASRHEDLVTAAYIARSWSGWAWFLYLTPGVFLYVAFDGGMNSALLYISRHYAGGALDDPSIESQRAVRATLHSGLLVTIFGVLGKEYILINWVQVIALTLVYVVGVGPEHIGYYPPRIVHFLGRITRLGPYPIRTEPWQIPLVLASTTLIFAFLMSSSIMLWVDTIAYNHSLKSWPSTPLNLDTMYRPPRLRSFEVIIAHSNGDSFDSIRDVISQYTSVPHIEGFKPKVIIYTKQANLELNLDPADPRSIRGGFDGEIVVKTLNNTGEVTATYLHHIVNSWKSLSQQMLFASTTTSPSSVPLEYSTQRIRNYFITAGFPIPDALRKTGFLHLGTQETCSCETCKDSLGWEDSTHLIPSMWGAIHPGNSSRCDQVVITLGNDFLVTAARIRAVPLDVWQVLYDGLTKDNMEYSWAHEDAKFPKLLEGQKREGRWDPDSGVYGQPDSLERPWLGLTVERLWAVLLQCSKPEIAWRCPPLDYSWRVGGSKEDCMCIDEPAM